MTTAATGVASGGQTWKPELINGFNVIGHLGFNTGLGNTARQFIRSLIENGYRVSLFDLDKDHKLNTHEYDILATSQTTTESIKYNVNLICINIDRTPDFFLRPPDELFKEDRINVGLIWWELMTVPKRWIEALKLFDAVLVGSHFVRNIFEANLDSVPIISIKHPIYLPENIKEDRARFNLPSDKTLFITSLDVLSDFERKNLLGAVSAFKKASYKCAEAHLVLKLNNYEVFQAQQDSEKKQLLNSILSLCTNEERIHIIAESLTYSDTLTLYASCDVLISLHRSEGLGLAPLEAMLLGKPVIATAWSGNLSYMNHQNSCLVGFEFKTVNGTAFVYSKKNVGKKAVWANPRIDEAASWIVKLTLDRDLRLKIGKKALEDAVKYNTEAKKMSFIKELDAVFLELETLSRPKNKVLQTHSLATAVKEFNLSCLHPMVRLKLAIVTILNRYILWRFH